MNTTNISPTYAHPNVDADAFRDVVGRFTSGVTVITTAPDGAPAGTTASAVSSLSLDPPMMLICLNRSSSTHEAIVKSGFFAVNILAQNQGDLAGKFARKGTDKFMDVSWSLVDDVPLLDGALATIICRTSETAAGGTHTVFMGEVVAADSSPGTPLTYYRGAFGRFEADVHERAYADTRRWVLGRRSPVGTELDPQELARECGVQPESIRDALVQLMAEGLVARTENGATTVAPLTEDMARGFFEAQAAMELGVIDSCLTDSTDADLDRVGAAAEDLRRLGANPASSLDDYLGAVTNFHRRFISLADSPQLELAYQKMNTGPMWRNTLDDRMWQSFIDPGYLTDIAHAARNRDIAAARTSIIRHCAAVSELAAQAIRERGGYI